MDVDLPSPLLTSRGSTQRLRYQSRYLRVTFGQSDSPDDLLLDSTTYLLLLQRPVQRLDRPTCVCSTGASAVSRRLTWFPTPKRPPTASVVSRTAVAAAAPRDGLEAVVNRPGESVRCEALPRCARRVHHAGASTAPKTGVEGRGRAPNGHGKP